MRKEVKLERVLGEWEWELSSPAGFLQVFWFCLLFTGVISYFTPARFVWESRNWMETTSTISSTARSSDRDSAHRATSCWSETTTKYCYTSYFDKIPSVGEPVTLRIDRDRLEVGYIVEGDRLNGGWYIAAPSLMFLGGLTLVSLYLALQ